MERLGVSALRMTSTLSRLEMITRSSCGILNLRGVPKLLESAPELAPPRKVAPPPGPNALPLCNPVVLSSLTLASSSLETMVSSTATALTATQPSWNNLLSGLKPWQFRHGKFLSVASHDNYIRVYNCYGWLKCGDVRKHTSAVLMIDWSADSRKMRSNSLDWELLFWDVTEAGEISQDPSGRSNNVSTKWQTNTMKFGWHVEGIFPKNVVEADHINRVTGNLEESLLATGDDFCNVRIFRNPARPGNVPRTYRGHGEHVTNVIFNGDKLFSTGGGDQTLIQWKKCE